MCDMLCEVVEEYDFIIIFGGVLVGEEDYIKFVVEVEGCLNFWQIVIKLGKFLVFGEVCWFEGMVGGLIVFFIGLLGNLVLSFVIFLLFVWLFVLCLQGVVDVVLKCILMCVDFVLFKGDCCNEFLCVCINVGGGLDLFLN